MNDCPTADSKRPLAVFLLLSLLLHIALLMVIRLPIGKTAVISSRPLEVYFSMAPIEEQLKAPSKRTAVKKLITRQITSATNEATIILPETPSSTPEQSREELATPGFMEAARSIAREQGKETEQQIAADAERLRNSPVGLLEQYMRMPHEEIRLANGILKIKTSIGSICYHPVPTFARDSASVFGIPTTCP
jgi:hypothetical protein